MTTTIDEVMATVTEARHRGPEALAALAMCYGADAVRWEIRHDALRRELIDTKRGMDTAREERDAAREALAAKDSAPRTPTVDEALARGWDDHRPDDAATQAASDAAQMAARRMRGGR